MKNIAMVDEDYKEMARGIGISPNICLSGKFFFFENVGGVNARENSDRKFLFLHRVRSLHFLMTSPFLPNLFSTFSSSRTTQYPDQHSAVTKMSPLDQLWKF